MNRFGITSFVLGYCVFFNLAQPAPDHCYEFTHTLV